MSLNSNYIHLKNHGLTVRDFLLDLLFPINCLGCLKENEIICRECFDKIIINQKMQCPECKKYNISSAYCPSCQTKNELRGLWISSDYHNELLAKIIKKLKYSFNKNLVPPLGDLLCKFISTNNIDQLFDDFENFIVIPVPLHKKRKKFRGFNQSEVLSINIANKLGLSLNTEQLIRKINTKAQAKLNRNERLNNVNDAFQWKGPKLDNAKIILLDDVASTKATLNNCAKILKQNGAKEVWGFVLAKN